MRYPKLTVFLAIVVIIVAWILISGHEPARENAGLAPMSGQPGEGPVFVIGGTRGTGLEIVRILRERGENVAILAREGSSTAAAEALGARIVRGDAMNPPDLQAALADGGYRAVISTLGGGVRGGPRPDFEGNRNAVDAARAAGIRRFVLVTVIGAGESYRAAPFIARRFLAEVIVDKTRAEDFLKTSGLDYTIIRPGGLLNHPAEARSFLTPDTRAMSWIGRQDLARLTVQALDDPAAVDQVYHAHDPDRTRFWAMFSGR
ncbi:MAG: SDR family oxidoreductase [Chromatiales bacterium]|nr:SDR family oxidoreductase [Chromatiales bacterium]